MISLYKNIMDIERVSIKPDDNGEAVKGWHVIAENVGCTLSKMRVINKSDSPNTSSEISLRIFVPLGIDIKRGDRVTIDKDIKLICQEPFKYKMLGKQEIEVDLWQG